MSTPHRATPEQWAHIEGYGRGNSSIDCCILELRARVEALEAAQRTTPMDELRAASAEARPGGVVEGLMEQGYGKTHARAAIRIVAAWLRTGWLLHAAELLEQEADRG